MECENYKSYMALLQYNFLIMFFSFLLYLIINMFLDSYFFKKCQFFISNCLTRQCFLRCGSSYNPRSISYDSKDSNSEKGYHTLSAKNLHKTYSGKQIVNNIDFSLKNGECMGILGVNGAGKTTTFRMLTREEIGDQGSVQIEDKGRYIDIKDDEYLQMLGYCPQVDSLNFVLTGRQILSLIAQLRGENNPEVVNTFLKTFELEEYADIPCGYYSGGNKRKLSLAVALIGYPKCVLLDEPTNGVDPSTRRKFWTLIKSVQERKKLSFILTSHSMVECEALCNNLKIMKGGKFEKEGTLSELKKEFGGFSIKLKLTNKERNSPKREIEIITVDDNSAEIKIKTDADSSAGIDDIEGYDDVDSISLIKDQEKFENIEELKQHFITTFGGEIKDEHSGSLHIYIIDKTKRWGTLFKEVELIKAQNSHLIEDYVISEASLEDIFLSVARSEEGNVDEKMSKKNKKLKKRGGTNTI